ncbi:MAG: HD domain-containing protein [Caulobacter sp.]|nr:HD domain-containing protein [Caulobacter sp.]
MTERLEPSVAYADLDSLIARLNTMATWVSAEADGITELDHGLQCAAELAATAPDDEALQIAGLVHDIGHGLCHIRDHDVVSAEAVRGVLGERVAALVGLHVLAKRYLVTTDPDYRARLSPISVASLAAQGGDLSESEVQAFEARDHWREALMLRRADESAKVAGRDVPGLDSWLPALARVAAGV